jgi:hypothetical protein
MIEQKKYEEAFLRVMMPSGPFELRISLPKEEKAKSDLMSLLQALDAAAQEWEKQNGR